MENASKALIIAGAILLSILLISLGILVYNNAKDTISDANLDSETIQTFNAKISQYCGKNKSANDMNGLMDAISASNGAQNIASVTEKHYISYTIKGTNASTYTTTGEGTVTVSNTSTSVVYPSFSTGTTYDASYSTGTNGYIVSVTITVN